MGILAGIAGIGSALAGLAGVGLGIANHVQNRSYAMNNFNLQKQQFDYEKSLQNQIFGREDTAVQRRLQDLKAAGLSPLLAVAGEGAGTGTPIATQAPQMDYSGLDLTSISSSLGRSITDAGIAIQTVLDMQTARERLNGLKLDTQLKQEELNNVKNYGSSLKQAQLDLSLEQIKNIKNSNSQNGVKNSLLVEELLRSRNQTKLSNFDVDNLPLKQLGLQLDYKGKKLLYEQDVHDYKIYRGLEKMIGLKFPFKNYVPLQFAGQTISGVFDAFTDIFGAKLMKAAGGALDKAINKIK